MPRGTALLIVAAALAVPGPIAAQTAPPVPAPPTFNVQVDVIATTPLEGVGLTLEQIPAPVQVTTAAEIAASGALDMSDFLNRRIAGVHVNEIQGNPFQADVNYRGYTASPLLGTPQGLSVFMDGVRINQPFGDVVSWDLIPRLAILSSALMPGSNPLFGLNTLGGALALHTKDGRSQSGTTVETTYGSHARRAVEFEHGGARTPGLSWYVAGHLFGDDGWRDDSPSTVRQLFGKMGWLQSTGDISLTVAHADNSLRGNGLQEPGFLARDFSSVYTTPDTTDNQSTFLNFAARRHPRERLTLSGNAYYRHLSADTLNGDINEESLHDPAHTFTGLLNRTDTRQHNGGAAAQATFQSAAAGRPNQFTVGGGLDRSTVGFAQSTELGRVNDDRSVSGLNVFDAEGVALDGRIQTASVYATDTFSPASAWHITLSGRYNRTTIHNVDRIDPGGGPGSLDGDHSFARLNPALGVTFSPGSSVNVYAGYSEGSRAATSIELGCANPEQPCKLPNALAGDPPLNQVVTNTIESGIRGTLRGRTTWNASAFRAANHDDVLFVMSEQTGFGYFRNFGETRRQGIELEVNTRVAHVTVGGSYTWLDATYRSAETVNGTGNSSNDAAQSGARGLEGSIDIEPGNRIPLIPRHTAKIYAELQLSADWSAGLDVLGVSSSYARGNENNAHEPDGTYYLAAGTSPGYAVANLDARYRVKPWLQLTVRVDNAFDRRYYTAAQLGPLGLDQKGALLVRPFPAVNGEYPVMQSTFFAPGSPRSFVVGARVSLR